MIQRVGRKNVILRGVRGSTSLGFRSLELVLDEVQSLVVALGVVLVPEEASFERRVQEVSEANLHHVSAEVADAELHTGFKQIDKSPCRPVALLHLRRATHAADVEQVVQDEVDGRMFVALEPVDGRLDELQRVGEVLEGIELGVGGNDFLKAKFIKIVVAEGLQRRLDLEDGLQAQGERVPSGLGLLDKLGCRNCNGKRKILSFEVLEKSRLIP